tara:strand:+ start:23336 stop:23965 length:630 start_codon:yes stop_codon:yes gene_type:complete
MEHITLEKIPHKRIRSFIKGQLNNDVQSVKDLEVSFRHGDSMKEFNKHERSYVTDSNIEDVWKYYMQTGPNKVFKDKLVSFALMLSKQNENEVLYKEGAFTKAEIGQVYFMNLSILRGLIQIAVSYEIIEIDPAKKIIDFAYIKGGKSVGIQRISFSEVKVNRTQIKHTTHYKSNSKFRDRYMYPYFHTKVLEEYHMNMIGFMKRKLVG